MLYLLLYHLVIYFCNDLKHNTIKTSAVILCIVPDLESWERQTAQSCFTMFLNTSKTVSTFNVSLTKMCSCFQMPSTFTVLCRIYAIKWQFFTNGWKGKWRFCNHTIPEKIQIQILTKFNEESVLKCCTKTTSNNQHHWHVLFISDAPIYNNHTHTPTHKLTCIYMHTHTHTCSCTQTLKQQ